MPRTAIGKDEGEPAAEIGLNDESSGARQQEELTTEDGCVKKIEN